MEIVWQDVRYAVRTLIRSPSFLTTVLVILALGIGVNTAIFSVVNAVLLRPMPYKDPERIVALWEQKQKEGLTEMATSHRNFLFWREHTRAFEDLTAAQNHRFYLTGTDRPRHVTAVAASSCLFSLLGVPPLLGRGFLPEEETPGKDHVVVLSHEFWREYSGGASDIVGKTLNLNGENYTIVGVMPPGFWFPFQRPAPFWVPLVLETGITSASVSRGTRGFARPKEGVTLEQAKAEMAVLAQRLEQVDPRVNGGYTVAVNRLLDDAVKDNRRLLWLLLGASGFVLLIACANAAGLFLARATMRQREIAVRVSLGASRACIIRQRLTESLVVSIAAGLLGLLAAFWTLKGLIGLCPADIPRIQETRIDTSVLIFSLAVSVLTGIVFGAVPAWKASGLHLAHTLKEGLRQSSITGLRGRRFRGCLVVSQISIALILLMGTGLLIRSLIALHKVDLGFRPENVLTLHIELPKMKYPESNHCKAFFEPLVQQVRALPGVRSAALVTAGLNLGSGGGYVGVQIDDEPADSPNGRRLARDMTVSSGFFEAMGIHVLKGRTFTDEDVQGNTRSAVIDENLARTYFPDTDPLGRKINGLTIVGVVSTLRDFETLTPVHSTFFTPLSSWYFQITDMVVRTDGDPMRLAPAVRAQVADLEPDPVIGAMEPLETTLSQMLAPRRFVMLLLSLFAGIALALATVGVYGLLQYSTTQQTHDIGIRMALGARRADILRAVVGQGLKLTFLGVVVGLAGAVALTRILSSLLYGVTATDPLTPACVSAVLIGIALLASYVPARRAARTDPMVALRYE